MKANELMIGDLVYCFDPDEPNDKQINEVSAIRVEYNEGAIKFEQFSDWFEEGWFEPIPLTPEILEKNGFIFVKDSNISISSTKLLDIRTSINFQYCNSDICFARLSHCGAGSYELRKYIRYVHELQHALRLCGFNDLADNFKVN